MRQKAPPTPKLVRKVLKPDGKAIKKIALIARLSQAIKKMAKMAKKKTKTKTKTKTKKILPPYYPPKGKLHKRNRRKYHCL